MKPAALLAVACVAVAGCGSGAKSRDGGAGASGLDGASGGNTGTGGAGGADPACASAVASQPCTTPGTSCGGADCTDPCQFCNVLQCMNGMWQAVESTPAQCWSCGTVFCAVNLQYCLIPGTATGSFMCATTPPACRTTPTCACLISQGVTTSDSCAEEGTGELLVVGP